MEKSQETGTVVAIGKGKSPVEDLKVGDLVAYRQFGESKLYIEGKEYLFCHISRHTRQDTMNEDRILAFREEARNKLFEGVEILADAVCTTLGPKGRNVAIQRPWGHTHRSSLMVLPLLDRLGMKTRSLTWESYL